MSLHEFLPLQSKCGNIYNLRQFLICFIHYRWVEGGVFVLLWGLGGLDVFFVFEEFTFSIPSLSILRFPSGCCGQVSPPQPALQLGHGTAKGEAGSKRRVAA